MQAESCLHLLFYKPFVCIFFCKFVLLNLSHTSITFSILSNMRSFILSFFLFSSFVVFSQSIQVGEKLVYQVHFGENDYHFAAKIQQLSPEIVFDYKLTSDRGLWGTATISKKAQESATNMYNNFSPDEHLLKLNNEVSVFPSKLMVDALTNKKEIRMNTGESEKSFHLGANKTIELSHFIFKEGKVAEEKLKIRAVALVSNDEKEHVWISTDLGTPLVVEMDLGWKISIQSWESAMPLTDKPQDMLGKALSASDMQALQHRLAFSSHIEKEDLSEENKPSLYEEYFCPMEGIRVKTHNDTVTNVLFYTEGFEHEDFRWRGYEGKFACGLLLNMTYQEVDAKIGKPTQPRWPTDVLIQYPQQKLIIYYKMPDNDKNKKAIANAKIDFIEFE